MSDSFRQSQSQLHLEHRPRRYHTGRLIFAAPWLNRLFFTHKLWRLHMRKSLLFVFLTALTAVTTAGAQEKVDSVMIAKIRAEGLQHSQVMDVFDHLVNVIGPRLTASPA